MGIDTVAPDMIYIGNHVAITSGTKILTHYLDPNKKGRIFRLGEVRIEDDVFIGLNVIICNSVTIGKGFHNRCWKCCDKRYSSLSGMGRKSSTIYKGACSLNN